MVQNLENPAFADDPRIATRGRPGASAVALGRRIMESANPQLKRHNSVSQLSKPSALDCQCWLAL